MSFSSTTTCSRGLEGEWNDGADSRPRRFSFWQDETRNMTRETWNVKCGTRNVETWNVEGEMWNEKCETWMRDGSRRTTRNAGWARDAKGQSGNQKG